MGNMVEVARTMFIYVNDDTNTQKTGQLDVQNQKSNFALAAARGMMDSDKDAETIAREAMAIAADICVYTNGKLTVEDLSE